jgi:membrane protein implicated in regulation of membrane protease activity
MSFQAWHVWMALGILFTIIEIMDPAFFFLSFAIGAIITGLLSFFPLIGGSIPIQIFFFALFSFIAFLLMRKLGKKILKHSGAETNVHALIGKTGVVTKQILPDAKGYVKIGGEEWSAVTQDNTEIEANQKVKILAIDGNKVIVEKA